MLESTFVTHAGPSQEGIEPIVHCSNQTHYTLSYLEIMKSQIECELQLESSPKFKILNKRERKDIDAMICHGTTLQVAPNFS